MPKSKLKISVGKNSGFCFGVKRAYDLACVNSKYCEEIYIWGKLVHNDDVCRDLKKKGIKEVDALEDISDATVIFTAHGIGPNAYQKAQSRGIKIIDTTCPKVMKAQRLAQAFCKKGYKIIIFGDKNHKEVQSILEWAGNNPIVISSQAEAKKLRLNRNLKYCLVSQTTQNEKEFDTVKKILLEKTKGMKCFATICDSTSSRQTEVRRLADDNDAVIVIGGRDSANSTRLFEIARKINKKSYFIENAKQLKKSWFDGIKKIAISAGASTPDWIIKEVLEKIKKDFSC